MKYLKKLIVLLISLLLILSFCGCKSSDSDESDNSAVVEQDLDEVLHNSIVTAMENVKKLDSEGIPEYITYIEKNVTLAVENSEQSENIATATVKIECPDLYTAVSNMAVDKEYYSEDELNQDIIAAMQETPLLSYEEVLQFDLADGEYKPVFTDTFVNAYYGGAMDLRQEWIESVIGGI